MDDLDFMRDRNRDAMCSREGCRARAGYLPGLRFWPEGEPRRLLALASEQILELPLCLEHMQEVRDTPMLIWTDDNWAALCRAVEQAGKLPPDRDSLVMFAVELEAR